LRTDKGLSFMWTFNQSGASTSNAAVNIYSSVDGTNVSSAPFASVTGTSAGTANVNVVTNWNRLQLDGLQDLVVSNIANATALTTLTNKGFVVRRPN
jgi:hypothetical protein